MSRFSVIAREIGELVEAKNAAYGDSIATAGAALRLLYPRGIPPAQMDDALLVGRIWDKLMRVATNRDAFGESPWVDIAGYAILAVEMQARLRLEKGGEVGSTTAAVSVAGMHQTGGRSRSILLERLPHEGLSGAKKNEGGVLPTLREGPARTGPPQKVVKRGRNNSNYKYQAGVSQLSNKSRRDL